MDNKNPHPGTRDRLDAALYSFRLKSSETTRNFSNGSFSRRSQLFCLGRNESSLAFSR